MIWKIIGGKGSFKSSNDLGGRDDSYGGGGKKKSFARIENRNRRWRGTSFPAEGMKATGRENRKRPNFQKKVLRLNGRPLDHPEGMSHGRMFLLPFQKGLRLQKKGISISIGGGADFANLMGKCSLVIAQTGDTKRGQRPKKRFVFSGVQRVRGGERKKLIRWVPMPRGGGSAITETKKRMFNSSSAEGSRKVNAAIGVV